MISLGFLVAVAVGLLDRALASPPADTATRKGQR